MTQVLAPGSSSLHVQFMAKLTQEQLTTVTQWAEDGATLNDIQQRLKEHFDISLTYLDARLLMLDVGVRIKDKARPPEPAPEESTPESDSASANDVPNIEGDADAEPAPAAPGKVQVTVDEICIPGALVSGKATFTDGGVISWYVDQMGRLGMRSPQQGYQPPPGDVADFQNRLDQVLMQQGF